MTQSVTLKLLCILQITFCAVRVVLLLNFDNDGAVCLPFSYILILTNLTTKCQLILVCEANFVNIAHVTDSVNCA